MLRHKKPSPLQRVCDDLLEFECVDAAEEARGYDGIEITNVEQMMNHIQTNFRKRNAMTLLCSFLRRNGDKIDIGIVYAYVDTAIMGSCRACASGDDSV